MEGLGAFLLSTVITMNKLTDLSSKRSAHVCGLRTGEVLSRSKSRSSRVAGQMI